MSFQDLLNQPLPSKVGVKTPVDTPFTEGYDEDIDGFEEGENKSKLELETDKARRICMYPWLIKPLSDLFGDKLANAGTTVSSDMFSANAIEDILVNIERNGGHIGENYASFVRAKMDRGLKPNADYVRCG